MRAKLSFCPSVVFFSLGLLIFSAGLCFANGEIILEDNSLLAAFDADSGALARMECKREHWVIERRPELGVSFRLFAPLPERRYNPVLGQKQRAVEVKKISENEVAFQWKNLISENGGALPITFTAHVTLTNGVMTFNATLENDSPLTVETIDYPYFGDLNPPSRDSSLQAKTLRNNKIGAIDSDELYPHFRNEIGYWGVSWPTKTLEARQSPVCLLQAPDEGMCVQVGDSNAPYRLQYTFEQHPGVISSVNSLVPRGDKISGHTVHLEFRLCHFVFAPPHSTTNLAPVVLRCYEGGMREGMNLYQSRQP
ncbi:MAG TPA: hypothetical protein VH595_04685 [Verrucomicrobiae bacterium]|jgi:hypothetical protein|nr:hypothetical protein [Verrucomicrobiae bacterium]